MGCGNRSLIADPREATNRTRAGILPAEGDP